MAMTPETRAALEGSIEKWRRIVEGEGKDEGVHNCPLCQIFNVGQDCEGCPVYEHTNEPGCWNTPFDDWDDLVEDKSQLPYSPEALAIAREELAFLESLRPKDE